MTSGRMDIEEFFSVLHDRGSVYVDTEFFAELLTSFPVAGGGRDDCLVLAAGMEVVRLSFLGPQCWLAERLVVAGVERAL